MTGIRAQLDSDVQVTRGGRTEAHTGQPASSERPEPPHEQVARLSSFANIDRDGIQPELRPAEHGEIRRFVDDALREVEEPLSRRALYLRSPKIPVSGGSDEISGECSRS